MIQNRKTVKGKLGNTRPKDTDWMGIASKKKKKTTTKTKTVKSNRPTDGKTKTLRYALKEKQKVAGEVGKGTRSNQAFLGGSASQIPKPKTKKTKRVIDTQKRSVPTKKKNDWAIGDQYGRPFGMKAGGKVKNKYYTGGSVHASFGKDYDDR